MTQSIHHLNELNCMCVSQCTHRSYLLIDLICIQRFPVGISAGVECAHKLIVVYKAVTVHVKDICHCVHFQRVGGKLYKSEV